jgi:diguanylate cyclase (GGDEF)-like protein/PAS domain S-box-containing protein
MTRVEVPHCDGLASVDERLGALAELVTGAIDAICLDSAFQVVALPQPLAELGFASSGWEQSELSRPLEAAHPDDRAVLMGLLARAREEGLASGPIRFTDIDQSCQLHTIDLVDVWGVYVFVRGGEWTRSTKVQQRIGRPRRLVFHRDAGAHFLWADENTPLVLGWSSAQLAAMAPVELLHPDDADRAVDSWLMMLAGGETEPVRLRYRHVSGAYRWFEAHNTNYLDDPERLFVQTELIDIDGEMTALARARDSELHFATLTESLPIGVVQIDSDGKIAFANDWIRALTGLGSGVLADLAWIAPRDREMLQSKIFEAIHDERHQECDVVVFDTQGEAHVCRVHLRPMPSTEDNGGAIALLEDVTVSRDLQRQLREQALTDELTGMPNRRGLNEWLARNRGAAVLQGLTIFFVDLDDFKLVNDVLGHAAGDEILTTVSKAISESVRPQDYVARIGGDEFIVAALGVTKTETANEVASRIVAAVARPLVINGQAVWLGCSVGIATTAPDACNIDRLISDADLAMYTAKREGGRRLAFFEHAQRRGVEDRLRSENDLRVALREQQFELYLQPVVNLLTGVVESAEALVRWNHPDRGLVSPADFIPTAERTGMICDLGAWILDEACRLASCWPDHSIAVNISPRQLAETGFVASVLCAIDSHQISPSSIVLEVTETIFFDTNAEVLQTLDQLVLNGVRIALDDFGTGFSSLNHLRQIPAQIVKVDRSYVADIGVDPGTAAIVEAIVGLTQRLGRNLIAEGIETNEQLAALREMGVVLGQGYLLGHPEPATTFFSRVAPAKKVS